MDIGRVVKIVISLGVVSGLSALMNYFALPAQTVHSGGFWWFWIIVFIIGAIVLGIVNFVSYDEDDALVIVNIICAILAVLATIIGIICSFASGKLANSAKYQRIIEVANDTEFESDFEDITENEVPIAIVDFETAQLVGNRTIGNISHSSWYEVDNEFNLIKYQGKYYRISSLNYGGLFKYRKAKTVGIPGFVLVDAENGNAIYHEVEGGYFYSPSACFGKDLTRHLRNLYPSKQFGQSFFEIDEEDNPYWITSVKSSTIGVWGGKQVSSILITDAITGKTEEYEIEDVPEWVDHCYDLSYLMGVVKYHYSYIDGYWNAFISETGVYKTSYEYRSDGKNDTEKFAGYNSVIGSDGEIYFYAGLTPANNAESNTGFIMINTRTGNVKQYNYQSPNAAEESSAQNAAESLVQNYGYESTFPIIVNVDGEETYLMTLKDKAGLVQRYSFCNVENYSIVVEAETIEEALNKYLEKLGKSTQVSEPEDISDEVSETNESTTPEETEITEPEEPKEIKNKVGVIEELYSASIEGTTYFYYKFEDDDVLYRASIVVNEMQIVAQIGDEVTLEYTEGNVFGEVTKIDF